MAFERVRDILNHAKDFHRRLGEFYAQCGAGADREKVRILLNYMSRHEANLAECLAMYEREAAARILDTWFKYPPEMPTCRCFECIRLEPDMGVDEIVEAALKVDACLLDLYRRTAEQSVSREVRDLFNELVEREKKEETECLRNALTFDEQG